MVKAKRPASALWAALLCLVLGLGVLTLSARADDGGSCGDSVSWSFTEADGTLAITGTGAMADYANSGVVPWFGLDVVTVTVSEGITRVGNNAFGGLFLDNVLLPESLTAIGRGAFDGTAVTEAHYAGNLKQWRENVTVGADNEALTDVIQCDAYVTYYCYGDELYGDSNGQLLYKLENGVLTITPYYNFQLELDYLMELDEEVSAPNGVNSQTALNHFKDDLGYGDYIYAAVFEEGVWMTGDACKGLRNLCSVTLPGSMRYVGWESEDSNNTWFDTQYAFSGCTNLQSIVIPEGVLRIGWGAFENCSALTAASLPSTLTGIGYNAFAYCTSLQSIAIPDSVTRSDSAIFTGCSALTNVTIGSGLTDIPMWAFYECSNLTSVTIPDGVTSIGNDAFSGCSSLTSVTIPTSVTSIGGDAFHGCSSLTSVTIPDNVTSIGGQAFYGCSSLTSVTIPGSLTSIANNTFRDCSGLTNVTIQDGVTSIGAHVFRNCSSLTSVIIPEGVTSIGENAFNWCTSLMSVTIPDSVTSIGSSAFSSCYSLTSVTIPEGVTSIAEFTFSACDILTSVNIPASVTSIGNHAFYNCGYLAHVYYDGTASMWNQVSISSDNGCLTGATLHPAVACGTDGNIIWTVRDSGLLKIAGSGTMTNYTANAPAPWTAYAGQITSIEVRPLVKNVGNNAFAGLDQLVSVSGMEGVTAVGANAFKDCDAVTEIPIPAVKSIGANAFSGCTSLAGISLPSTVTSMGQNAFAGCTLLTSAGPAGSGAAIEFGWASVIPNNAFYGADRLETVTLPEGVTRIGTSAFRGCAALTEADLPSTLKNIYDHAFEDCAALTAVTLPAGLTGIRDSAFTYTGLTEITIPTSVTSFGAFAFSHSGLERVVLADGLKVVGECAFVDCRSLTEVSIPASITDLANQAFSGCEALTDVSLADGLTTLGSATFAGCVSLTELNVPASVTTGSSLFRGCTGLTSAGPAGSGAAITFAWTEGFPAGFFHESLLEAVTLPDGLAAIDEDTFSDCAALDSVYVPFSVKTVGDGAFDGAAALTAVTYEASSQAWDRIAVGTNNAPLTALQPTCLGSDLIITQHPADATGAPFGSLTLSAAASGDYLAWQWYMRKTDETEFTALPGMTDASCTLDLRREMDGARVYCEVTDRWETTLQSTEAGLEVFTPLAIVSQPQSFGGQLGDWVEITVEAEGDDLTYAWYYKEPGATKFRLTKTFTGNSYEVELTEARSGRQVYCIVTDCRGDSLRTDTVSMFIGTPLAILTQPADYAGALGSTASFTVGAEGDGLTYQWWVKTPKSSKFTRSSITSPAYSVVLTAARNGNLLYCVVTDAHGDSVQTDTVSMTAAATPLSILAQPVDYAGPKGSTATFTVGAEGDGLTYQWWVKTPKNTKFTRSSITSPVYSVELTAARNGNRLYCVVTDAYGNSVQTETVSMTVFTPLVILTQPVDYEGALGSTASFTVEAEGDGLTYQWWVKTPKRTIFTRSSITSPVYSVELTAARNGNLLYCMITDAHGNSVQTDTVSMTVSAP